MNTPHQDQQPRNEPPSMVVPEVTTKTAGDLTPIIPKAYERASLDLERALRGSLVEAQGLLKRWKLDGESLSSLHSIGGEVHDLSRSWQDISPETHELITTTLCEGISGLRDFIVSTVRETEAFLDAMDEIDESKLSQVNEQALSDLLKTEFNAEIIIELALQRISQCTDSLSNNCISSAREHFGARVGAFDGRLDSSFAPYVASLQGLAVSGYLTLSTLHPLLHHRAAEMLDHLHSPVTYVPALVGAFISIATVDFVAFSSGGTIASLATGAFKTAAGRLNRLTTKGKASFEPVQEMADRTQETLRTATADITQSLALLNARLKAHYERNDLLRREVSHRINKDGGNEAAETGQGEHIAALENFNRSIGTQEVQHRVKGLLLERTSRALTKIDIRSRELQRNSNRNSPEQQEQMSTNSPIADFLVSADENGPRMASHQAHHFHEILEASSGGFFTGFGSTMSSLHDMMIQTARDPVTAVLDTVKGGASALDFGKDKPDGPTLLQLGGQIFAVEDFQHGDYWKWFGKVLPNTGLVAFKKVYFIIKAQKDELKRGKISRSLLKKQFADSEGLVSHYEAQAMAIGKTLLRATGGMIGKRLLETPLRFLASVERRLRVTRYLSSKTGVSPTEALEKWFAARAVAVHYGPFGLPSISKLVPSDVRRSISERGTSMSDQEFQLLVLEKLADYDAGRNHTTPRSMEALFKFWEGRDELRWLESQARMAKHQLYLAGIDSQLGELPMALRLKSGWLAKAVGKVIPPLRPVMRPEERYRQLRQRTFQNDKPTTVLDTTLDGKLVLLLDNGTLKATAKHQAAQQLRKEARKYASEKRTMPLVASPYADEARVATVEALLGSPLDEGPGQPARIIRAHKDARNLKGKNDFIELARYLAQGSFSVRQLFGDHSHSSNSGFGGIFPSGLIGNRRYPKSWIKAARKALLAEGYPL